MKETDLKQWILKNCEVPIQDAVKLDFKIGFPTFGTLSQTGQIYENYFDEMWSYLVENSTSHYPPFNFLTTNGLELVNSDASFKDHFVKTVIRMICYDLIVENEGN